MRFVYLDSPDDLRRLVRHLIKTGNFSRFVGIAENGGKTSIISDPSKQGGLRLKGCFCVPPDFMDPAAVTAKSDAVMRKINDAIERANNGRSISHSRMVLEQRRRAREKMLRQKEIESHNRRTAADDRGKISDLLKEKEISVHWKRHPKNGIWQGELLTAFGGRFVYLADWEQRSRV